MKYLNRILEYLSSRPRNKIVFHDQELIDKTLNVGYCISSYYQSLEFDIHSSHLVDWLIEKIQENSYSHHSLGRVVAIKNLGVLFEKDLKVDFVSLVKRLSRNNLLFVKWEGHIDGDVFYFLSKEEGVRISMSGLSYLRI